MATKRRSKDLSWRPKRSFAERDGALLLTPGEAADILATKERHIWDLLNRGEIPKTKVGQKVRIHKDDLAAYIKAQRGSRDGG
jgi:excisionase family DNA binding protein